MTFKREEAKEEIAIVPIHMRTSDELRAILSNYVGNFEKELNEAKDNIPGNSLGVSRAITEGKLPDCGMWWLKDRGVTNWYVKNGWIVTQKIGKQKRQWKISQKYIDDGIDKLESALEELMNRREYSKKMNEEANNQI